MKTTHRLDLKQENITARQCKHLPVRGQVLNEPKVKKLKEKNIQAVKVYILESIIVIYRQFFRELLKIEEPLMFFICMCNT